MRPLFVCKFIRVLPFVVWGLTVACGSDDPSAASTHCTGASCSPGEGKDAGIETDDGGSWAKPDAASCTPSGADVPDDDFADQNCDGIDGDLEKAIFVAPSGSDAAQGTRESPVKTLNKATALAAASGKDVYACNGSYAEALVVSSAVRLYGGYDCKNGWARNKELAVIAPGTQGQGDHCAPSTTFQNLATVRTDPPGVGVGYELIKAYALLARGWAVAITDYEGLGTPGIHSYVNREASARAVLDLARAAPTVPGADVGPGPRTVFIGYSQGGGSVAAAARCAR